MELGASAPEIIRAVVEVGWLVLVASALWFARRPIVEDLLPRLTGATFAGVGFTFEAVDRTLADLADERQIEMAPSARRRIFSRARRLAKRLRRTQLLWVDDSPRRNVLERQLLRRFGVFVDLAKSNDEAEDRFLESPYDVVISDIGRGSGESGLALPDRLARADPRRPPVIFYVTTLKEDTPHGAVGITNRPDTLMDLILDCVEKQEQ
jgi:CheY-like chemotaxis protein